MLLRWYQNKMLEMIDLAKKDGLPIDFATGFACALDCATAKMTGVLAQSITKDVGKDPIFSLLGASQMLYHTHIAAHALLGHEPECEGAKATYDFIESTLKKKYMGESFNKLMRALDKLIPSEQPEAPEA